MFKWTVCLFYYSSQDLHFIYEKLAFSMDTDKTEEGEKVIYKIWTLFRLD